LKVSSDRITVTFACELPLLHLSAEARDSSRGRTCNNPSRHRIRSSLCGRAASLSQASPWRLDRPGSLAEQRAEPHVVGGENRATPQRPRIGPNLDEMKPSYERVVKQVTNPRGLDRLPPSMITFGPDTFTESDIRDIAAFVFIATHG
jgi:hypothetical protein